MSQAPPPEPLGPALEADADPAPAADEDLAERRHAVAGDEAHGQRLDKVLVALAPEFSRSHLQALVESGHVLVDGLQARQPSRRLRAGQSIDLELVPTAESRAFLPQAMPIDVVFEDEHLLVLDKPAGLVVHPAAGNWSGTLLNGLLARHPTAASLPRAGIVHRLDKDTSGLMLVGKSLAAVTALVRAIAERRVHRRYIALVHGCPREDAFTIEGPIGRDPRNRLRMALVAGGKPARTDVLRLACRGGVAAVSCTLHSGRTHQIRVHLASRGHPLLADTLYGGAPALGMVRQALHATELRLEHPVLSTPVHLQRAPPADLAAAWRTTADAGA